MYVRKNFVTRVWEKRRKQDGVKGAWKHPHRHWNIKIWALRYVLMCFCRMKYLLSWLTPKSQATGTRKFDTTLRSRRTSFEVKAALRRSSASASNNLEIKISRRSKTIRYILTMRVLPSCRTRSHTRHPRLWQSGLGILIVFQGFWCKKQVLWRVLKCRFHSHQPPACLSWRYWYRTACKRQQHLNDHAIFYK